ncbi:MAG: hypothetical protein V1776_01475 [Candidatus Diapherotrites archaeon]
MPRHHFAMAPLILLLLLAAVVYVSTDYSTPTGGVATTSTKGSANKQAEPEIVNEFWKFSNSVKTVNMDVTVEKICGGKIDDKDKHEAVLTPEEGTENKEGTIEMDVDGWFDDAEGDYTAEKNDEDGSVKVKANCGTNEEENNAMDSDITIQPDGSYSASNTEYEDGSETTTTVPGNVTGSGTEEDPYTITITKDEGKNDAGEECSEVIIITYSFEYE